MILVADETILTEGTLEECMCKSNSMTWEARKKIKDIWIQEEPYLVPFPTKVIELRTDGVEHLVSLDIKEYNENNHKYIQLES